MRETSNAVPRSGLVVLHGNRLEALREVVVAWLLREPLAPLAEEIFLVQSNAAADWLKRSLAERTGLCAATRFELPGRFLWRMYRRVLGPVVAERASLDRSALTWRLMNRLPALLSRDAFEPVRRFLADRDAERLFQLSTRLADLFDQYQVYRGDWLAAWEAGRPVLISANGAERRLPDDQRWQAELWRALLTEPGAGLQWSSRSNVHRAFVEAIARDAASAQTLPRRVILFGASHVSAQGLEALHALSARMQVICAVTDPCRFHWSDVADGREVQAAAARRPRRPTPDGGQVVLADVPPAALHLHAHPLLVAWGRQGRDFMRLLDHFDAGPDAGDWQAEVFDDDPGSTLLGQVQAAIRDLLPTAEHPRRNVARDDRSIVFEVAHSAQREVEILHDRLLERLAVGDLRPRDVVVMVPDIADFAPAIRAVFGQHEDGDPRAIPFDIADVAARDSDALVAGLDWLLRLPDERLRLRELRDLLEIPSAAARAGIAASAIPGVFDWLAGAGVRWGLDGTHRARLGLGAAGEQNSWSFGLSRMLLGYAAGTRTEADAFAGIEPYDEIGGLEAAAIGALCALVDRVERWLAVTTDARPAEWGERARALLDDFFAPTDDRARLTLAAVRDALAGWLTTCETAGFDDPIPLTVMRESWLAGMDGLDVRRRVLGGGVTFCTLMPLRAVPFDVVCLLGMNDGDFPRAQDRDDFDLLALADQQRPGDRARREDDRYLMLEALLSARRALHVSWQGRSVRDNRPEPPSVLVAQFRDYLDRCWRGADDGDVLRQLTTEHPLQPFSRRYFDAGAHDGSLKTYAHEWQAAHRELRPVSAAALAAIDDAPRALLTIRQLERFLRNPVAVFFATRLDVHGPRADDATDDDETLALGALDAHRLCTALLEDADAVLDDGVGAVVARRIERLRGTGELPMFELGERVAADAAKMARSILGRWVACRGLRPRKVEPLPLRLSTLAFDVDDWLAPLYADGDPGTPVWIATTASPLVEKKRIRAEMLLRAWLRTLLAVGGGLPAHGVLIGRDVVLTIAPPAADAAAAALAALSDAWRDGALRPLPFAMKTALAVLRDRNAARALYDGGYQRPDGENADFALRRIYPTFDRLARHADFGRLVNALAGPIERWIEESVRIDRTIVATESA